MHPPLDASNLPDEIEILKQIVIEPLKLQLSLLRRMQFGRSKPDRQYGARRPLIFQPDPPISEGLYLRENYLITHEQAQALCADVVNSLAAWPSLNAALQSGGLEVKAACIVSAAVTRLGFLTDRLVLREYNHADFVLVRPASVGGAELEIRTVIEVKFNYARQLADIAARPPVAVDQAKRYRKALEAPCAYVLYYIAAPFVASIPAHPRDGGWEYWNYPMAPAVAQFHAAVAGVQANVMAQYAVEAPMALYCALVEWN